MGLVNMKSIDKINEMYYQSSINDINNSLANIIDELPSNRIIEILTDEEKEMINKVSVKIPKIKRVYYNF